MFRAHQPPKTLISDNFKSYKSHKLKKYLNTHHTKHIFTTAYHPQSNGLVERVNQTVKTSIRLLMAEHPKRKWSTLLPLAGENYNGTIHSATKFAPVHVLIGRDDSPIPSNLLLDDVRFQARKNSNLNKEHQKIQFDKKHPIHNFSVSDLVLKIAPPNHPKFSKLSPVYTAPFKIISFTSPLTVTLLHTETDETITAHVSQLKPFVTR